MISKESEYLIHAAEEQLERLNKSLYFYQKQSELDSDILSSSISMNCSNNFKDNSSISLDINANGLNLKTDLKPIYKIIKKQRDEYSSGSSFRRKLKESEKKKQLQKSHSSISCVDNIRDWRNGVNLVKKTLGPNNRLSQNSPVTKSQSVSPCCLKKRERTSTFWNDEGNKRNSKSPKKNVLNSNRIENNCCSRRNADKEEIQRYIRNKQKLDREKRFEADLTLKAKKENIKASLNSLENYHYDKFTQYLSAKQNYQKHKNDYNYTKSCSMSSLNKSKLPTPIYDELEKDGFLDCFEPGNHDHNFISSLSAKYKNGLNSTVDSGIETGEWYRSLTPEKFRNSYDRINEHNSFLSTHLPIMSQPTSQTDLRQNRKYKDSQFKTSYHNKFKQKYQEQISAYDASSENEFVQENEDINKYSQSPELSVVSGEVIKNSKTSSIRIKLGVNENQEILELNSKLSESPSNKRFSSCSIVDNCQSNTACKLSNEATNKIDNKITLIQDLKEALFNAQIQLNLENKETEEAVSERISLAVKNFIKTKESLESTRPSSCISPLSVHSANQNICDTNTKVKSKGSSPPESNYIKRNNKKDVSTEFEATEMEFEMAKKSNRLLTKSVNEDLKETIEVDRISNDESTHDINVENNSLMSLDLSINLPKPNDISTFKETLQKREERANELIKLTKDLQKESKRVIKLEKKAFEISKRFIPGLKTDNKIYRTDELTTFSKHLTLSDIKNDEKFSEYQQTLKMTNPHFHPNDSSNELPEFDKVLHSQSSQSENDEITISISEVTTTLTDQSELEARLLALQSEMKKKKQLVSTLKRRQKDMKRDKIKQKEVVLQKQIEMYDDYIEKLQTSVNQLNSKIDEYAEDANNSDDSHTLTGSNLNLTDLDSKKSHDLIPNDNQPENLLIDIDNHGTHNILINNVLPVLATEHCESQDILNTEITHDSRTASLDSLIENNKHIQTSDQDLDDLLENYQDDYENESEPNDEQSRHTANKFIIEDLINFSNLQTDDKIHSPEMMPLDGINEYIPPTEIDNLFDFSANINSGNLGQNVNTNVDFTVIPTDEFDLNDLVQLNVEDKESVNDTILHRLYLKASNSDIGDTNSLLDNLLHINTEPILLSEFEKSEKNRISLSNNEEIKSSESHNEFDDKKKPILVEDILEICIADKENQKNVYTYSVSANNIDNDNQSESDFSSRSSSLKLSGVNQMKVKTNNENSVPVLVANIDEDENLENKIQFAEIDIESKSSISDSESLSNSFKDSHEITKPIEIVHDSYANFGKSEITIQNTPALHISSLKIEEISNHLLDNEELNYIPEKSMNFSNVDKLVDILLNKLIISEIENFKPTLAEVHQEDLFPQTSESVVQNQSTSLIEENVNNLPLIEGKDVLTNVIQSEDLWDLGELTVEDPNIPFNSTIPEFDRELLKEKVSWLIPLKSEYIDPLVEAAIKHFLEYKKIHSVITEEVLSNDENNFPYLYSFVNPIVDETEIISALFESVSQKSYIDRRIIFHIVLEIILEIYLFEKHSPQPPWIHSSYMLKNNVYSLWKGDTAPESYDLVKKIVRRRIDVLIDQKNISITESKFLIKDNDSQSKIIRWCIRQQKDDVDKLLINDLRKEENEWIYYDEAEEEVKFQIAEEIFHILVIDTISWIKSISDEN